MVGCFFLIKGGSGFVKLKITTVSRAPFWAVHKWGEMAERGWHVPRRHPSPPSDAHSLGGAATVLCRVVVGQDFCLQRKSLLRRTLPPPPPEGLPPCPAVLPPSHVLPTCGSSCTACLPPPQWRGPRVAGSFWPCDCALIRTAVLLCLPFQHEDCGCGGCLWQ